MLDSLIRQRSTTVEGMVFTTVCVYVCFFRTISQKPMQQDHQTWHRNVPRWVPEILLFGVKRSKVKVTKQKLLPTWVFALLWVLHASSSLSCIRCTRHILTMTIAHFAVALEKEHYYYYYYFYFIIIILIPKILKISGIKNNMELKPKAGWL